MSLERITQAYDRIRQSGELRPTGQPGGQGGPVRQELTGTLHITSDGTRGDLNGRTGGGAVGSVTAPA